MPSSEPLRRRDGFTATQKQPKTMTAKNNGETCDHCGTHWTATNSETLHKIGGQWTCEDCACPSVIEDL